MYIEVCISIDICCFLFKLSLRFFLIKNGFLGFVFVYSHLLETCLYVSSYLLKIVFFFQRFILRIFLNYCSDVCVSDLSHQYLQVNFSYHEAREQNLTNKDGLVHY